MAAEGDVLSPSKIDFVSGLMINRQKAWINACLKYGKRPVILWNDRPFQFIVYANRTGQLKKEVPYISEDMPGRIYLQQKNYSRAILNTTFLTLSQPSIRTAGL